MVTAFVFPLLDAFFMILWVFLFALWIWIVISIVLDVFSSHDLGGLAKGAWLLLIVLLPLIGSVIYLIFRGDKIATRRLARRASGVSYAEWFDSGLNRAGQNDQKFVADELEKLANLRDRGVITDEDLDRQKHRLVD